MIAEQTRFSLEQATEKARIQFTDRDGTKHLHVFMPSNTYNDFDFAPLHILTDFMMDAGWEAVDTYASGVRWFAAAVAQCQRDKVGGLSYAMTVTTAVDSWRCMCRITGPYADQALTNHGGWFCWQEVGFTLPLPTGEYLNLWMRAGVRATRNTNPATAPLAFGQRWWQEWRDRCPLDFLTRYVRESRGDVDEDEDDDEDDTNNEGEDE